MTTEWDDTPWAGTPARPPAKALTPWNIKAVTGAGVSAYLNDPPLTLWSDDPQARAKTFLKAYKCGWFYKAESKISGDLARLPWTVSDGDIESDDPEEVEIGRPDLDVPFDTLNPIEQFMRLMERPNPQQTGRMLRQKTFIRRDMAGWTFWYLETTAPVAPITAIYGISPSRLWPSYDKRSGELLGWILDYDKNGGTMTFEPHEIVAFSNASADDIVGGVEYGVGVVEAVYAELPLTDLMSRHTADLLSTGGRLAGMMWPRERALDEDEFNDAQRAWRNVVSDPNSARRMLLFPEPMEYASGAATPKDVGIPELAELNRDNILTAFPIAPEVLGVSMPAGQNASGETRRELYDWYWRGTIEPRSASYDEVIQVHIVSRYEQMMGQTFRFETELPDLDDANTLLEKGGAFRTLTDLGFDPKAVIKAVGLDHIKWIGKPKPEPVVEGEEPKETLNVTVQDESRDNVDVQQSLTKKSIKARDDVVDRNDPRIREFLGAQRDRVETGIRETMPKPVKGRKSAPKAVMQEWAIKDSPDWWDGDLEDDLLAEVLDGLYVDAARGSLQVVADKVDGIIPNRAVGRIVADLKTYGGERISGINGTTLEAVRDALAEGSRRGYSLDQLIEGVPDEGYSGLRGLPAFDDARAEMIARTETMLSYNRAALDAYGEFGVKHVIAYDGDKDAECADRNGREFSIDDALAIADHPNGTLDWAPVTDKAWHGEDRMLKMVSELAANMRPIINADSVSVPVSIDSTPLAEQVARVETAIREQPAPIVNVAPTPPAPVVFAKARNDVQNVRIVDDITPPKKKRVVRGAPTKQYPLGPVEGVE